MIFPKSSAKSPAGASREFVVTAGITVVVKDGHCQKIKSEHIDGVVFQANPSATTITRCVRRYIRALSDAAALSSCNDAASRSHRDYLLAAGEMVFHIMGPGQVKEAEMNPAAQVLPDGRLTYPAES